MALSHRINRFSLGSSSNMDKKLDIDLVTKHLKKDNVTSSSKINSDKQKNEEEKEVQKNEEKVVQAESIENKPEQAKVENNSDANAKENEIGKDIKAQSSKKKSEPRGISSNCDLCDKTFPSKISLRRHKMAEHKDSKYYPYNAIEIVSTPGKSENQTTKTNLKENISNNSTTDNAKSPGRNKRKTM